MAPGQKLYPRGTVKKIIKAHSNCNVSKNVDVTVSAIQLERVTYSDIQSLTISCIPDLFGLCPIHANASLEMSTGSITVTDPFPGS